MGNAPVGGGAPAAARLGRSVGGLAAGLICPREHLDVQRTEHALAAGFDAGIAEIDDAVVMRFHGTSSLQGATKMSRNPKLWVEEKPIHLIIRILSNDICRRNQSVTELKKANTGRTT